MTLRRRFVGRRTRVLTATAVLLVTAGAVAIIVALNRQTTSSTPAAQITVAPVARAPVSLACDNYGCHGFDALRWLLG